MPSPSSKESATDTDPSSLTVPHGIDRHRATRDILVLPCISGLLAYAALPKVDQGYLAWVAYIPLLLLIGRRPTPARACLAGFLAGLVQMACLLAWVPAVMETYGGVPRPVAWALYGLLVALQASYPAAACALARLITSRCGERLLLVFPFVWVSMEYLETRFPFGGFPWMLIGYSQTRYSWLMQIADVTAVHGVSFLVISVNTALAWCWLHKGTCSQRLGPVAAAGTLLLFCLFYGKLSLSRWESVLPDNTVAMLQKNISIDEPSATMEAKFRDGYVQMAGKIPPDSVDLLILPESPSPLSFQYDEDYSGLIRQLARRYPMGIVFSNIAFTDHGAEQGYYNSAYFLDREGRELGRYDKIHLVPFGEYVPLKKLFFFVEAISKDVSDFRPGDKYVSVSIRDRSVSAVICFEAVFPQLVREFVMRNAELLINLSNDRWYGDSAAPYQHLAMARWRAVENRRYLLRATNSGISAVIDPLGRVQSSSRLLSEDICVGRFGFVSARSLYTRYGDVLVFLCVIITLCLLLACLIRPRWRSLQWPR